MSSDSETSTPAFFVPGEKLANPLQMLPPRRPDSVRRTSSMQIVPDPTWDRGFHVHGAAQDSSADADSEIAYGQLFPLEVDVDDASNIVGISAELPQPILDGLIGRPAISGFRAILAGLAGQGVDLTSPTAALLDDLPTVRLISGYARLMKEPPRALPVAGAHPTLNVCRGWAEGDTAHRRSMIGESLVNTTTAGPTFDQMLAEAADFHAEPASVPDSMRRRRIFEVTRTATGYDLFEYFRDSYVDDDGAESSLHEYIVRATADHELVLTDIVVEPRSLPFPECPLASQNATVLRGVSLRSVHDAVRATLSGTRGCTHLTDTLRFLRFTEALSASLN